METKAAGGKDGMARCRVPFEPEQFLHCQLSLPPTALCAAVLSDPNIFI